MRKFIWICDRCRAEIEPRVLDKGEIYLTRKKSDDVDLCEDCLKSLAVWFSTINSCDGEEKQQGKWIFHEDYNENCKYGCNKCGSLNNIPSNFCPNCGVKMKDA